jgi:hypothetical protein
MIEYFGLLEGRQGQTMKYELDCLVTEPVPALNYLRKQSELKSLMCPVVIDYLQNAYIITSPLDWTITRHERSFEITNDRQGKPLDGFIQIGGPEPGELYGQPMIHFNLQYYFVPEKNSNVIMEVLDPPLINCQWRNVVGEYNISNWIHPTNFCFFMSKDVNTLSFKREDPLMAVRFRSDKGRVKLQEVLDDNRKDTIRNESQKGMSIKDYYPRIPLKDSFGLFKKRMWSLWKK